MGRDYMCKYVVIYYKADKSGDYVEGADSIGEAKERVKESVEWMKKADISKVVVCKQHKGRGWSDEKVIYEKYDEDNNGEVEDDNY